MQGPLAGAGSEPADHEPARALGFLHLAEDRLDGLATAAVEVPATLGEELALHALAGSEVARHAPPRRRQITSGCLLAMIVAWRSAARPPRSRSRHWPPTSTRRRPARRRARLPRR